MWELMAIGGSLTAAASAGVYWVRKHTLESDADAVSAHNSRAKYYVAEAEKADLDETADYYRRLADAAGLAPPDYSGPRGRATDLPTDGYQGLPPARQVYDVNDLAPPPNPDGYDWISGKDKKDKKDEEGDR